MSAGPELVWVFDSRVVRPGAEPRRFRQTWVHAPTGDGLWSIGYRVVTVGGAPCVAEARLWPTARPPWGSLEPWDDAPAVAPSLDRAQRALSPQAALAFWCDESSRATAFEAPLPGGTGYLFGFAPTAPLVMRPDDDSYLPAAEGYVRHKRLSAEQTPHRGLSRELGVTPERSRKLVHECRRRGLLDGDEVSAYARELRSRADRAA